MQNLPIKTSSEYEKAYNNFKSSDLAQKLSEKYRVRPFYEKYAKLYRAVSVASYGLNFFSVATATTCVFSFLMAMLPYPFLCACIAVVSLTMIEMFKRLTIPSFFQSYFQFKKLTISKLSFIFVLVAFSVTLSYTGAKDTVLLLTPKAELTDVQATKQPFSERIKALEKQKREIKRSMSWQGKLTPQGAKAYNEVTVQIGRIENEMMQSISKASTYNDKTLIDHKSNTSLRAEYFGAITLFLDLALIALFFFMELYQFKSYCEFANLEQEQESSYKSNELQSVATNEQQNVTLPNNGIEQSKIIDFPVATANNGFSLNANTVQLAIKKAKANISAYRAKLKKGEGKDDTNNEGIERWSENLNQLEQIQLQVSE